MPFTFLARPGPLLVILLFLAMVLLLEAGRLWGVRRRAEEPEGAASGHGSIEGTVFALLGLLIAFTFAAAAARFEARRALVIEESNIIGTAWLRLDLLPAPVQLPLRDLFRRYLDSRIEVSRRLPDLEAALAELDRSTRIQGEIWTQAVRACREAGDPATTQLVLSAVNQLIDVTTTRIWAARTRTPRIILVLLGIFALAGSFLAGFAMSEARRRSWVHILGFAGLMAITIFVIVDLENPREGLIRLDETDRVLMDLRRSMN